MPWLKFDEKQWEELKQALERVVNVAKDIAAEMKRANDLKERGSEEKEKKVCRKQSFMPPAE